MLLDLRKCSLHKPINCHGPSHKYYHYIPHIIQLKLSTNKYSSYYYQNWTAKLHYPHTNPNIIWLVGKTQRKPKIPKSHYDVANSKSPTMMWQIPKSATMRHYLQSPLLHGIFKARYDPASLKARYDPPPLKARCYTAPFTKPVATRQYFTKSQNYFP